MYWTQSLCIGVITWGCGMSSFGSLFYRKFQWLTSAVYFSHLTLEAVFSAALITINDLGHHHIENISSMGSSYLDQIIRMNKSAISLVLSSYVQTILLLDWFHLSILWNIVIRFRSVVSNPGYCRASLSCYQFSRHNTLSISLSDHISSFLFPTNKKKQFIHINNLAGNPGAFFSHDLFISWSFPGC